MPDIYVAPKSKKHKKVSKIDRTIRQEVYSLASQAKTHFHAFLARPDGFKFETQIEEEEIIVLLRKHWITNLGWIFLTVLMIFAPILLNFMPLLDFLPGRFQFFALVFWYLLVIAFILERFLSWYFNVNIITDERIIDINFYSLIYKEIADAEIDQIQDVTLVMGGAVRTIFNFGTVYVQTAAEKPRFAFEDIPNPALVVKILEKMRIEEEQEAIEGRVR